MASPLCRWARRMWESAEGRLISRGRLGHNAKEGRTVRRIKR